MKRIWSIILALVMLLSLMPLGTVAQTAAVTVTDDTTVTEDTAVTEDATVAEDATVSTETETDLVITVGETLTIDIVAGEITYVKFIPVVSGNYTFTSLSSDDTYGYLCDADKEAFAEDDDYGSGNNFAVTYDLEAGVTYYCGARYYSSNSGSFDVQLVCNSVLCDHATTTEYLEVSATCTTDGYTAGVFCAICQTWVSGHEVIPAHHTDEDADGICDVCDEQTELIIRAGETLTVDIVAGEITYIKFVPAVSGNYTFTSLSSDDTYGYLCDADKYDITYNDDDVTSNFSITYDLEAGVTYYWGARYYNSSRSGSFDVKLVCNSVQCDHSNTTEHPEQPATCTADGYTAGVFCEDCQTWLSGHELIGKHHTDENEDAVCDLCDDEIELLYGGECGDNLTFALYESGLLIIRGTGEMANWNFWDVSAPWLYYSEQIRKVVIEEGVTSIGQNAFCSEDSYYDYNDHFYPHLTEIVIPDTVTTIQTNGISGLDVLETITLPASVTTMVGAAINNNYALKQFVVAEENPVYKAVDGVLFSKDGKTLVCYPIGSLAESYTVPQGTETIAAYAFSQCSTALKEIIFNEELTFIDDEAFQSCDGLTSIELPDSLKELGGGVFQECSNLADISLPSGMTRIGGLAFQCTAYFDDWNNWEDGVLYLDSYMLDTNYCPNHLDWDEWKEKSGTLTVRAGTTLIADEAADMIDLDAVVFNDELQHIGFCAFGWLDITSVSLPDSLLTLGDWAFYNCELLGSVRIGSNLQYIGHDVLGATPYDTAENYVDGILYYGPYVLGFNDDLPQDVVIREGTTIIAERAFWKEDGSLNTPDYGAGMRSISFPATLHTICDGAFYSCNNLKTVTIPSTVTTIGHQAFGWIKGYDRDIDEETFEKMTDVTIEGYIDSAAETYAAENDIPFVALNAETPDIDGDDAYGTVTNSGTCGDNLAWKLYDSGTLVISGEGEMWDYTNVINSADDFTPWRELGFSIVVIENGVTNIGRCAFSGCRGLTSITIPNSVTNIGRSAFFECRGLTSLTIPGSVTSIGIGAFDYCTSLTSITLPDSVTSIGNEAFQYCTSLTSITISNSVTSIGDYVFQYCSSLTSITIPDSVTSIGDKAFYNCTSLTSVTIGNSVTSIGRRAFSHCTSLTSVTIPDSVTSIGEEAFCICSSLTNITVDENNPNYCSADGVLFTKDKTELHTYPAGKTASSYTIPDSVMSIGTFAFDWCTSLTSVTIPDSVTSIGAYAFHFCNSLTSITIPSSVTSMGLYIFDGCSNLTIYGYTGSYAETYAEENGIPFVVLDEQEPDVGEWMSGDVDNDGEITNMDLGLLQRFINGWGIEINVSAGDVDRDGEITNLDLGILQRYINGWDVELK